MEILASTEDAKVLAGGQSLVPAMNFRLARPTHLVDINRISQLDYTHLDGAVLRIGALARHRRMESPVEPGRLGTALAHIAKFVGHVPIRTRGTFAGSLAHADPASEWCVVAQTLDAELVATGPDGERMVTADRFFRTIFTTDLEPNELLTEVRLPLLSDDHRVGFAEFSRRAGDFALIMAMAVLEVRDEVVTSARIGIGGATATAIRATHAEQALVGLAAAEDVGVIAGEAAAASIEPLGDIHGSPEYRTDLIRSMTRRAVVGALRS